MEIEKHIFRMLHNVDCVIIPGFGGFVSQLIQADIHPVSNKFTPPAKKVVFNESLKKDDGALVHYISEKEDCSEEDAQKAISGFVGSIHQSLSMWGFFELKEVGRFLKKVDGKLEFESSPKQNLLDDSFGLPEMIFKPIERKNNMITRPAKKSETTDDYSDEFDNENRSKKNFKILFALLPLVVILGLGAFLYVNKNNDSMKAKFPFSVFFGTENKEIVEETPVAEAPEVIEEPVTIENPEYHEVAISGKQANYSIIIGSFNNKKNADRLKSKIESQGDKALIIEPDDKSRFYRVSVAEFNDKEAAIQSVYQMRGKYGPDAWVMSN